MMRPYFIAFLAPRLKVRPKRAPYRCFGTNLKIVLTQHLCCYDNWRIYESGGFLSTFILSHVRVY